jgi:hypothetical protein
MVVGVLKKSISQLSVLSVPHAPRLCDPAGVVASEIETG